MVRVCHQGLGMEDVTPDELPDCHCQVDEQTDSCDPHAGVILVLGDQVDIIMVVVMMVTVAVARVTSCLCCHEWNDCQRARGVSRDIGGGEREGLEEFMAWTTVTARMRDKDTPLGWPAGTGDAGELLKEDEAAEGWL